MHWEKIYKISSQKNAIEKENAFNFWAGTHFKWKIEQYYTILLYHHNIVLLYYYNIVLYVSKFLNTLKDFVRKWGYKNLGSQQELISNERL